MVKIETTGEGGRSSSSYASWTMLNHRPARHAVSELLVLLLLLMYRGRAEIEHDAYISS